MLSVVSHTQLAAAMTGDLFSDSAAILGPPMTTFLPSPEPVEFPPGYPLPSAFGFPAPFPVKPLATYHNMDTSFKQVEIQKTPQRTSVTCAVCRSAGATLHYGGVVCGGCKIFFARAVQRKVYYVCDHNGRCNMVTGKRTKCRSCRFQQCLKAKMCPEEVGKLREPREEENVKVVAKEESAVVPYFDAQSLKTSLYAQTSGLGTVLLKQISMTQGVQQVVRMFVNLERACDNDGASTSVRTPTFSLDVSLVDAIRNPFSVCERTPARWQSSVGVELNEEVVRRCYCRLVCHYLEWISAVEDLYMLPNDDRMKIVAGQLCSVLTLVVCYNSYKKGSSGLLLSQQVEYTKQFNDGKVCSILNAVLARMKTKVLARMEALGLTDEEFVLMKLIMLFDNVNTSMNEETTGLARAIRTKYQCLLAAYLQETNNDVMDTTKHHRFHNETLSKESRRPELFGRVAEIINLVHCIAGISQIPSALLTHMVSQDVAGLQGTLSYDLHLRTRFT